MPRLGRRADRPRAQARRRPRRQGEDHGLARPRRPGRQVSRSADRSTVRSLVPPALRRLRHPHRLISQPWAS
jgi:hypothetical protein